MSLKIEVKKLKRIVPIEKGFDNKTTRYWTSPAGWDKWEEEKQKGIGKENELIKPRTKFAIEHSKHTQSKEPIYHPTPEKLNINEITHDLFKAKKQYKKLKRQI